MEHDLNSRVYLGEGFNYHRYLDKLFNINDKTIHLSKIEKEMILTLIEHEGEFASVDILTIKAWKKDEVSIYTFRNMIKKIRNMRKDKYFKIVVDLYNQDNESLAKELIENNLAVSYHGGKKVKDWCE